MRPCLAAPGGFCGADGPCGHPWTYPAHTRGDLCRTGGPSPTDARRADALLCAPPHGGASSPGPWVTFSPMRKSPKNLPEGRPLWVLPLGGIIIPPAARACMRLLLPPERVCATNPDRFATLSLWANRSSFLPRFLRGHTFWFQAVARQVGELMVRVASALGREQGLPIFLSLIQGKTAGYPVGSAGRT